MVIIQYIILIYFACFPGTYSLDTTEYVPVIMWSYRNITKEVSSLRTINESEFIDGILKKVKNNQKLLVFLEEELSPEDFTTVSAVFGEKIFKNLEKIYKSAFTNYYPYVKSPINAIKKAYSTKMLDMSVEDKIDWNSIKGNIIISLDVGNDSMERYELLKQHDDFISKVSGNILNFNDFLMIYTSMKASWVNSYCDRIIEKQKRIHHDSHQLRHIGDGLVKFDKTKLTVKDKNYELKSLTSHKSQTFDRSGIYLTYTDEITVTFHLLVCFNTWSLNDIVVTHENVTSTFGPKSIGHVGAHLGRSYETESLTFTNELGENLYLENPQFQANKEFKNDNPDDNNDDSCQPIMTIPILSAYLTLALLLFILFFGIYGMMSLKTMDRFDNTILGGNEFD